MPQERPCNICGLRPAGSREHLPGVGAANAGPVRVRYISPSRSGPSMQRVERVEPEGFMVRTICGHCNMRTGGNYGTAYKEFVLQFSRSGVLDAGAKRTWISLERIQPLRVIKQMSTMFLAAQPELNLDHWGDLRRFVLGKDRKLPTGTLRFYLYRNSGNIGRISALSGLSFLFARPRAGPVVISEISWPPVGLVCANDFHPVLGSMKEITEWGQASFKAVENFGFTVPQLMVEADWPLGFGTQREVNKWIKDTGAVWFLTAWEEGGAPTQVAATFRQLPKRRER